MNMYKNFEGYSDPTVGAAYSKICKKERLDKRGEARKVKYRRRYCRSHNGGAVSKRAPKNKSMLRSIFVRMEKASSKVKAFCRKEKQHGC